MLPILRNVTLSLVLFTLTSEACNAQDFDRRDKDAQFDQILRDFSKSTGIVVTRSAREVVYNNFGGFTGVEPHGLLERFPVLHIVVVPVPPRNYTVNINGNDYDPTPASLYGVVRGTTEVRIERVGVPPCIWRKDVQRNEEITCKLPLTDGSKPSAQ